MIVHCHEKAWLVTAPHPDPSKRRRMVRRFGGKLVTLYRLPVHAVTVLELRPLSSTARVRFLVTDRTDSKARALVWAGLACFFLPQRTDTQVDAVVPYARLASSRGKFRARFLALSQVIPDGPASSGDKLTLPAKTMPGRP